MVLGIVAGILAGVRKGGFVDNLVLVSTLVVIAIPIFVLGFLAQLVLGVRFGLVPGVGHPATASTATCCRPWCWGRSPWPTSPG